MPIYELNNPDILIPKVDDINSLIQQSGKNLLSNMVPPVLGIDPFNGGAGFQATGLNAIGMNITDFSNVSPRVPESPLDIFSQFKQYKIVNSTT